MIEIREIDKTEYGLYDSIPMTVEVCSEYRLVKPENGLGGILLREEPVDRYVKDLGKYCKVEELEHEFDLTNWTVRLASNDGKPVGGCIMLCRDEKLSERDDIGILWDLRVRGDYKRTGLGTRLVREAAAWAKARGLRGISIECQNNNVPACKFYARMGASLREIRENAYWREKECESETRLTWMLEM